MSPALRDGLGRRALELAVLCAFAFAQPLFDLLGRNPEFFAVRGSPGGDIVLFAVGLVLLPPLVLTGVEALAGLAGPRARDAVHAVLVALLGALIAIPVVKRFGGLTAGLELAFALAVGLALAWGLALRRGRVARTVVTVLSPAPLLFLALFLLGSRATQLVLAEHAEVTTASARPGAPVVMVVFDEFPATSLLDRDGRIDRVRYPSFATLAARSTWYSRATTVADYTTHAVPAIVDGRRPRKGSLPTLAQHPRNLFTLLGRSYRLNVSEEATHLCPRSLCPNVVQPSLGRRLRSLAFDSGVVYAHLVLPAALEDSLPSISQGWGDFHGGDAGGAAVLELLGGGGRAARFEAWVRSIRPSSSPPALNFKHVLLPHVPWQYLPDGHGYGRGGGRPPGLTGPQAANDPFLMRQRYQRHLLQAGFTDRLLGRLIARLRETGLWDRALVVVTADHGVSFRVGQADQRSATPENVEDIAPVPLFVKAPGQRTGRVSTRALQTIDILPTIADELGVHMPWRVDGRSAEEPVPAGRPAVDMLTRARGALRVDAADLERRMRAALARKVRFFGSGSGGPGLYAVGPHRELLGRPVSALGATDGDGASAAIDAVSELADVDLHGVLPVQLTGRLSGADPGRHDLALAVNGRVATVSRSFPWEGQERFSAFAPPQTFRPGRNVVEVLLVPPSGPPRRLGGNSRASAQGPVAAESPLASQTAATRLRSDPRPYAP